MAVPLLVVGVLTKITQQIIDTLFLYVTVSRVTSVLLQRDVGNMSIVKVRTVCEVVTKKSECQIGDEIV